MASGLPVNSEMMDSARSRQRESSSCMPTESPRIAIPIPPRKPSKASGAHIADCPDHQQSGKHHNLVLAELLLQRSYLSPACEAQVGAGKTLTPMFSSRGERIFFCPYCPQLAI